MQAQIKMFIFVIVMGLFSSTVLVGMEYITADRIATNDAVKLQRNVLSAFEIDYTEETIKEVYEENVKAIEKEGMNFYRANGDEIGFLFGGSGLWGPITGVITFEDNIETIKSIQVITQEETPGLGGVVGEQEYLQHFKGKKVDPILLISKNNGIENADNEVDGIAGATLTSDAFEVLINESIQLHREKWVK